MAMSEQPQPVAGAAASTTKARTSFGILGAISLSHLLNDMIQSLILAIYPLLQSEFSLTFMQIGMITLTFQLASSLLQPVVGYWTDKYPMPWSLPIGAACAGGQFWRSSAGGGAGRYRFIGLSSGIFSRGPYGFRRAAWPGAIYLSGRRQLWQFPGTLAGGGDYRALWQRQRCLVCACGTAGDRGVGANQPLVLGTAPNE